MREFNKIIQKEDKIYMFQINMEIEVKIIVEI